jgi:phosphoribosyl 1,2-cyclic phosphodiesterase/ActR/RegA family two-component response regulator
MSGMSTKDKDLLNIVVLDDDDLMIAVVTGLLEHMGHTVKSFSNGQLALDYIKSNIPDLVLSDIMMPDMDGMQFLHQIRNDSDLDTTKVIMVSAKSFEYDRRQAMKMGANGFITKPIDHELFMKTIMEIIADQIEVTFWGVRGTLPVPGPRAFRYGGNTPCITLAFSRGQYFIFDAGSGIKELSNHLLATGGNKLDAKIFISHPHWDHINALPFFTPLFIPGNEFEVLGARQANVSMRELISAQMDDVYFPITLKEFSARVYFRDLGQEEFEIDDITIKTMLLNHPGNCLGYRIEYGGRSFCYITDNEMFLPDSQFYNSEYVEQLTTFVKETDALVIDSTYTDSEYASKVGWGHSCIGQVTELAHNANVKVLYLFHHDPDQDDDAIDAKLVEAEMHLKKLNSSTQVLAPAETHTVKI